MFKSIEKTKFIPLEYPIAIASPLLDKGEVLLSESIKVDDVLKSFLRSILYEQINDPLKANNKITVLEILRRNWMRSTGYGDHKAPMYLDFNMEDSHQSIKMVWAYFYVNFQFVMERVRSTLKENKEDELFFFKYRLTDIFKELPAMLLPLVHQVHWSDCDYLLKHLETKPGLENFVNYLNKVNPSRYDYREVNDKETKKKTMLEYRKSFFRQLISYAAIEHLSSLINEKLNKRNLFKKCNLSDVVWRSDNPNSIFKKMDKRIIDLLGMKNTFGNDKFPFVAEKGAVYSIVYPLPKRLVLKRVGNKNLEIEKEDLARFQDLANQRLVELHPYDGMPKRLKSMAEVPHFSEKIFIGALSADPSYLRIPKCLLNPELNFKNSEYVFGCSLGCKGWNAHNEEWCYWHPFHECWVAHVPSNIHLINHFLKNDKKEDGTHVLEINPINFCPYCGAPMCQGKPYLIKGHLPITKKAYRYSEDYIEIKHPEMKYHIDLWDRILQFYFRGQFKDCTTLTIPDNYVYMSDNKIRSGKPVELKRDGGDLLVNDCFFSKQELIYLSFVLYQLPIDYKEAIMGEKYESQLLVTDVRKDLKNGRS